MNSRSKSPEIRQEAFTQAREKLGWSLKDLAGKACLSVRQIEQIENGEMSSFYGAQIKLTAAKKVAAILGLGEAEAFDHSESPTSMRNEVAAEVQNQATQVPTEKLSAHEVVKTVELKAQTHSSVHEKKFESSVAQSTNAQQKNISKTRLIVWGGLLASVVFAAVNLRPLFLKEQPAEIIIVKEEVIEPPTEVATDSKGAPAVPVTAAIPETAPTAVPTANAATATANTEPCPSADAIMPSYKPSAPRKAGDMVYLQTKNKQVVCVIDATGKSQSKTIEPGLGASFYGAPPFKVLTSGLAQVEIYFQGAKVRPDNADGKSILLEAGNLVQPAAPVDSQLR